MSRRIYPLKLKINGVTLNRVIIDPHYEEKHRASITDEVIIELVKIMDRRAFVPVEIDEDGYSYFVNDYIEFNKIFYKLIWLLHESETYLGVVNAYRRRKK